MKAKLNMLPVTRIYYPDSTYKDFCQWNSKVYEVPGSCYPIGKFIVKERSSYDRNIKMISIDFYQYDSEVYQGIIEILNSVKK